MPRALRPFRRPPYRLLATALALSLLGVGIWAVALVFQVRELGGGPVELSVVAALNATGLIAAVLVGGAIADRVPQQRILIVVEAVKAAVIVTLGVLGLLGVMELWQLAVGAVLLGLADGFFYPAYSALLPSLLVPDELLAANGIEGVLRPVVMSAIGPAAAGVLIAALSPSAAFVVIGFTQALAIGVLVLLGSMPVQRVLEAGRAPVRGMLVDIAEGVRFVVRTPWLFATLLFASVFVLVVMGPIEVLLPFAVLDRTGGGPESFALVLAAYGIGSAATSLIVASLPLPRRYLTVMLAGWAIGCVPLAAVGVTDQLWLMVVAGFLVGSGFALGQVIWGTLLQRRVPPAMLGRVSSLDFFVSLVFMPISMALAGPVGEAIGFGPAFAAAGLIPLVLAAVTYLVARMARDEVEHPLSTEPPVEGDAGAPPPAA